MGPPLHSIELRKESIYLIPGNIKGVTEVKVARKVETVEILNVAVFFSAAACCFVSSYLG